MIVYKKNKKKISMYSCVIVAGWLMMLLFILLVADCSVAIAIAGNKMRSVL